MKKGVRADSVRMAQRLCSFGSMIVRFGSANVMSYTPRHPQSHHHVAPIQRRPVAARHAHEQRPIRIG